MRRCILGMHQCRTRTPDCGKHGAWPRAGDSCSCGRHAEEMGLFPKSWEAPWFQRIWALSCCQLWWCKKCCCFTLLPFLHTLLKPITPLHNMMSKKCHTDNDEWSQRMKPDIYSYVVTNINWIRKFSLYLIVYFKISRNNCCTNIQGIQKLLDVLATLM